MKTYLVGGAVRDKLLGRLPRDSDFIVTNGRHEEMMDAGFIPVGKDHAVYLHPDTKEEYGLADNLLDDLGRRDLTINAMALDGENIIDPYQGQSDIGKKILRHVKAENFFFDPLRVYRVARLASELPDFRIDSSTIELLQKVSKEKAFDDITPERILRELDKALRSERPSIFFKTLKQIDSLTVHFPEIEALNPHDWEHTLSVLDKINAFNNPAASYGGLFIHTTEDAPESLSARLLVPTNWKKAAEVTQECFVNLCKDLTAEDMVNIFYQIDAYRNSSIVDTLNALLISDDRKSASHFLLSSYELTRNISVGDLSTKPTGKELGQAIKRERIKRLEFFLR